MLTKRGVCVEGGFGRLLQAHGGAVLLVARPLLGLPNEALRELLRRYACLLHAHGGAVLLVTRPQLRPTRCL